MSLPDLPKREDKPRKTGITMVMDKGLSLSETENLIQVAGHLIDFTKLGFGTSIVSKNVKEKVSLYHQAGIRVFLGGTLFEACLIRNRIDYYEELINDFNVDAVEISDGSMIIDHKEKCKFISHFSKQRTVLSEVGAKEADVFTDPPLWSNYMNAELEAGSSFVIGEARESGNVGIYKNTGVADEKLIDEIIKNVASEKIIWEAPMKKQQVWFIKQIGANVNLGNIAPSDVIPLETLRLGLRGDTFFEFLPSNFQNLKIGNKN